MQQCFICMLALCRFCAVLAHLASCSNPFFPASWEACFQVQRCWWAGLLGLVLSADAAFTQAMGFATFWKACMQPQPTPGVPVEGQLLVAVVNSHTNTGAVPVLMPLYILRYLAMRQRSSASVLVRHKWGACFVPRCIITSSSARRYLLQVHIGPSPGMDVVPLPIPGLCCVAACVAGGVVRGCAASWGWYHLGQVSPVFAC